MMRHPWKLRLERRHPNRTPGARRGRPTTALPTFLLALGLGLALAAAPAAPRAAAQPMARPAVEPDRTAEYIRSHYSKREVRIPMRDGVELFTVIYAPNDDALKGTTYPILLNRTAYSVAPYGADRYKDDLGPTDDGCGWGCCRTEDS